MRNKKDIFTKAQWTGMQVISAPTSTRAMIKADAAGRKWLWVAGGKRITAERVMA